MPFQISRNGQLYGPYSLEELHRYLASGHIQPTDLLKDESMPEWIPVSQFVQSQTGSQTGFPTGSQAAAAPPGVYTSTYAGGSGPASQPGPAYPPRAAAYAVTTSTYPDPPDLPWLLALLIGIFTGGLFFIVWDLVIASWAKRVQPTSKALLYYIAAAVLAVLNAGASYGIVLAAMQHTPMHHSAFGSLLGIAAWVVRLIARFTLRANLEDHYNGPEPIGLRLSGIMTFFFGGLYFQNRLNRVNEVKRAFRSGSPVI